MPNDTITAIEGLRVGHAHNIKARTGCTVVLLRPEADVAFEARGGWPGTYDTHSIEATKTFVRKHAIFLTGGDIFGFDVATGIRRYLIEKGFASRKGAGKLPGIVGANIYDVEFAETESANYASLGYRACVNASAAPVAEGNVGAGMGATVGKFCGRQFGCKGGCGTNAMRLSNGLRVGALIITNSYGNIYDYQTGRVVSGARQSNGQFVEFDDILRRGEEHASRGGNTTIGIVATNAVLSHEQLLKVAQMAHDGLAMTIRPVHTSLDGDTIFATTTAKVALKPKPTPVDVVGFLASLSVAKSVLRSVWAARSLGGMRGFADTG